MIGFGVSVLYFCAGLLGLAIFAFACIWLIGFLIGTAGRVFNHYERRRLVITLGIGTVIGMAIAASIPIADLLSR